MPAAAVIPAPIAYTKVVAVKKLVVGFLRGWGDRVLQMASRVSNARASCHEPRYHSFGGVLGTGSFTLRKFECSKQATRLENCSME